MTEANSKKPKETLSEEPKKNGSDKVALYISIAILAIIIIVAISSLTNCNNGKGLFSLNNPTTGVVVTAAPVNIAAENGNRKKLIDTDIVFKRVDFSRSIKEVQSYEEKQTDTLDNPSTAKSTDGYTYLTYHFDQTKTIKFFGTKVIPSSINSCLVYVFVKDKLSEVRVQYGELNVETFKALTERLNKKYGNFVYSRTLTDATDEKVWNTKDVCLDIIYQTGNTIAYFKKN